MAKPHILVIEDDEDIRELVGYNLEKEGFRVVQAESGEKGLKAANEKLPNLIILDLMLPDMDGFGSAAGSSSSLRHSRFR